MYEVKYQTSFRTAMETEKLKLLQLGVHIRCQVKKLFTNLDPNTGRNMCTKCVPTSELQLQLKAMVAIFRCWIKKSCTSPRISRKWQLQISYGFDSDAGRAWDNQKRIGPKNLSVVTFKISLFHDILSTIHHYEQSLLFMSKMESELVIALIFSPSSPCLALP